MAKKREVARRKTGGIAEAQSAEPAPVSAGEAQLGLAAPVRQGRESILIFADAVQELSTAAEAALPSPELHLVAVQLDREEFGIPISRVREVIRVNDITRVPQAPPHIRGVINLRGRILPVVEIKTRLGLASAVVTARSRIVVVEAHGRVLGMLVDAVSNIVHVPVDTVVPPPDEVLSAHTDYITGVARLGTRLLILLDLDKALLLQVSGEQ